MTEFILASKKEVVQFSSFQEMVKQNIVCAYFTGFYFWFRLWVSKFVYLVNILLFLVKLPFVSIGIGVYMVVQVIQVFLITSWGAILSFCIWPHFYQKYHNSFPPFLMFIIHSADISWVFFWFWGFWQGNTEYFIKFKLPCY